MDVQEYGYLGVDKYMEHYTLYTEIHPWTLTNATKRRGEEIQAPLKSSRCRVFLMSILAFPVWNISRLSKHS